MKRYLIYIILGVQLLFDCFSVSFCARHKILFIGDSITQGKGCLPGFRDDVYQSLDALGFPFEFVGSVEPSSPYRAYCFNSAVIPDFYEKNGQYNVISEMNQTKPDIVVIHLGSNDFWLYNQTIQGGPYTMDGGTTFTEQVSGHVARLLALLAQWHDGSRGNHLETVFLCQIIPKTWRHMGEKGIPMLNADLIRLAEDIEAGRVPSIPPGLVRLVDQFSTFTNAMFYDDNHPNCSGYRNMGRIFFDAFRTLPMHLLAADGADQRVLPGNPVPMPITFKVTDDFGSPVADVPVVFDIAGGDGSILSDWVTLSDSTGTVYVNMEMGQSDSCLLLAHASGLIDSIATQILHIRNTIFLSGQITYFGNGDPVSDVKVRWQEQGSDVYSGLSGSFRIDGVPIHTSVTLIPEKENSAQQDDGVHIYEAALIARHVVGLAPFDVFQAQAADIDRDGQVSMADAALIARLVVGLESTQNTALGHWLFSPSVMRLDADVVDVDSLKITAVRIGDIFQPAEFSTGDSDYHVRIGMEKLSKLSESTASLLIPVQVTGPNVSAAEFTIHWDAGKTAFLGIQDIQPGFSVYYNSNCEGELNVALFSSMSVSGSFDLFSLAFDDGEYGMTGVRIDEAFINSREVTRSTTFAEDIRIERENGIGYNSPNPFNGETRIPFRLDREEQVYISIVNVLGQTVKVLSEKMWSRGHHQILWDGRDEQGMELSSGIYLIIFKTDRQNMIKRMELLR